jgi:hypothetical protein
MTTPSCGAVTTFRSVFARALVCRSRNDVNLLDEPNSNLDAVGEQGQLLVRLDDADAEADLNAVGGKIGALGAETSASRSNFRTSRNSLPMSEASSKRVMQRGRRSLTLSKQCSK